MITTAHKRQLMSKQGSNMIYYHGTDATSALTIASHKIDVTKGKGELGKGFYVGNQMHRAFAWAYHKNPKNYNVVRFVIDAEALLQLDIIFVDREYAEKEWAKMKSEDYEKTEENYEYHHDAVWAPVIGGNIDNMNQIKFESQKGESFINNAPAEIL